MNILRELVKNTEEKMAIRTLLGEETYCFAWRSPATFDDIETFEKKNKCSIPNDYKEFLLVSNGAIIFQSESEYEDDGYKLLSLKEMEEVTKEMIEDGYEISSM